MRHLTIVFAAWAAGGVLGAAAWAQQTPASEPAAASPAVLLEKGIYTEETVGDLDAAIGIYQRIVDDARANRQYVAQAQYRLAMCHLKKGDKAMAAAELRTLVATFPQEKELAVQAQRELAKLLPSAAVGQPLSLSSRATPDEARLALAFLQNPALPRAIYEAISKQDAKLALAACDELLSQSTRVLHALRNSEGEQEFRALIELVEKIRAATERGDLKTAKMLFESAPGGFTFDVKGYFESIIRGAAPTDAPCVVKTTPAAFANDVDSSLDRITVTFDRPMMDKSWSFTAGDEGFSEKTGTIFPERAGEISYDAARLTCTMPVKLQPGKVYWVGVNSPSFQNFKSAGGAPARPYQILFATKAPDFLVGGGLSIEFTAPSDGVVYLYQHGKLLQTKTVTKNDTSHWFGQVKVSEGLNVGLDDDARLYFAPATGTDTSSASTIASLAASAGGFRPEHISDSHLVGGGANIEFVAPADGIAYLWINSRLAQTKSARKGEKLKWLGTVHLSQGRSLNLDDDGRLFFKPYTAFADGKPTPLPKELVKLAGAINAAARRLAQAESPAASLAEARAVGEVLLQLLKAGRVEAAFALATPEYRQGHPKGFGELTSRLDLSDAKVSDVLASKESACVVLSGLAVKGSDKSVSMGLGLRRYGDKFLIRDVDALPNEAAKQEFIAGFQKSLFAAEPVRREYVDPAYVRGAEETTAEGWRLLNERKLAEAEAKFKTATALDPTNANGWNGLGWAQFHRGEKLKAKESFGRALKIDPKMPGALNGLALIAKAQGKTDEAIGLWRRAVEAMPSATAALSGLAAAYAERGQFEKATEQYRAWLKVDPDSADAKAGLEKAQADDKALLAGVESWLGLLDAGEYVKAWESAGPLVRQAMPDKDQWAKIMKVVREDMGKFKSRKLDQRQFVESVPGLSGGPLIALRHLSTFEKKQVYENAVVMKGPTGAWGVVGYTLAPVTLEPMK